MKSPVFCEAARGYFSLNSPQHQLLEALNVVTQRSIWAPRAALALLTGPPPTAPTPPALETEEQVMIALLREGLSNKEMAARLGIAEVTVKARLTRLFKRFGVNTRLQLLAAAIRAEVV